MPSKPEKRSEVKPEKKINAKQGRTHGLSQPLTGEESYKNDHLTHAAFVSIAILTFITFVGNFTQLQLSAALPTIVSDFGISVTTGQWLTSIFQLVMGVMVPLTAYLTRRFSTRQIVIASMAVFTLGSVFAWLGSIVRTGFDGRPSAGSRRHRRDVAGPANHGILHLSVCPAAVWRWAPSAWP